jgi:hypothetical protein
VGQPKQPREENGKRRKLVAARSLDNVIMAILAAVDSSIEIRTLDDWYSQPAAIVIRSQSTGRRQKPSKTTHRPNKLATGISVLATIIFRWERLRWNCSLGVKWSLAAGMLV